MLFRFGMKQIHPASSGLFITPQKTHQVVKKGPSIKALTVLRQFHNSGYRQAHKPNMPCVVYSEVSPKLRAKQALFQMDNDIPVFLKGGIKDQILYRFTVAMNIIGYIMSMIALLARDKPGEK